MNFTFALDEALIPHYIGWRLYEMDFRIMVGVWIKSRPTIEYSSPPLSVNI